MNRLHAELQRLYFASSFAPDHASAPPVPLLGPEGQVRAMVLAVQGPAAWDVLGPAWRGLQADWGLPAPAIAVSGTDACQLWLSLAQPVPAEQAAAFLDAVRRHYLGEVAAHRLALWPAATGGSSGSGSTRTLPVLPPTEAAHGHWSAFVAPDLAALFSDEPWLDMPPSPDAQADLLSRLACIRPEVFAQATQRMAMDDAPAAAPAPTRVERPAEPSPSTVFGAGPADARHFLQVVMNDPSVDLRLRIEAAKALLTLAPGR